ncbi:MAG: MBL fold metallo-hydrolase [Candidatus Heimdallarchaeota archaeon]|nr:MBL fold metallo-hydrolase [Candidatus Heimdallarchaeota archaeon]MCK4878816.1 MBL fold metallo-hydrolase [Candidatus Heimdallarchaeota archaeon]
MPEYNVITVIFFRIKGGKYSFYLTKKGENLPILPSSWSPIGSLITKEDEELYVMLQNKYGDIAPDMLKRLTALRIVFERNLFHTEKLVELDIHENVHDLISKIDQELLNVWFHSMLPCGFQRLQSGDNIFNTNYFLFISPSNPSLRTMKIKRTSEIFNSTKIAVEVNSRWFEAENISKDFHNLKKLFSPSITALVEKITTDFKKPFEAAREMEQLRGISKRISFQIFPYTWRFSVPAPTLPPYNTTNIYVVGNEKKYIIDPGSNEFESIKDLTKFIEKNRDTMEGILLTNPYPDHCNQAIYLKETYDLPVCTSIENTKILKQEGFVFSSILKEGINIPLGSNPKLNLENWELETIELPGSSEGSIGFWDSRGLLFSGIALHRELTTTNASYPESYSEFLDSIKKIKNLKVNFALSGHGRIITDVKKTLSQNKQRMKKIEKELSIALKQGISDIDGLTDVIIDKKTSEWRFYMKRIVISALEKLAQDGNVTKIGSEYIWRKHKNS